MTGATIIKSYIQRGRHFTIAQNEDGFFLAIEDKYITDGKLNRTLNGFQMYASKSLQDCLTSLRNAIEIEYLESQGHSKAEAFAIHFNMLDKLEEIEKAFA